MSAASEIRNVARKVSEAKSDLSKENTSCNSQIESTKTWWTGEAGKGFRDGYKELKSEIQSLIKKMGEMPDSLKRLADKVDQADAAKTVTK